MHHSTYVARACALACCALLSFVHLSHAAAIHEDEQDAPQPTHVIARGPMQLRVTAEARLEAGRVAKVRLTPEAYTGTFEIAEVLTRAGRVEPGQLLLRFDDEPLNDQIRSAQTTLAETAERLAFEHQELDVLRQSNATRIHRAEKALADAQLTWELWQTSQGQRMLRAADLNTRQRLSSVLNQREELAQLKAMYQGAELESATKEIVLERAMRSLEIAEEWLDIVREDERIIIDHTHPQRARDTRDEVRYREEALAHARIQSTIAETRKQRALQQATRSHEDAVKRAQQLERDRQLLTIAAPIGGLLKPIDQEPGDRLNNRQIAVEIHDDSTLRVTFAATPNDLRALHEGQEITVRATELPEVVMTGHIQSISTIGRASGKQTYFDVIVHISEPHELARIGLNVSLKATTTLHNVLMINREAVHWEDGIPHVDVLVDGDVHRRAIVIAASNNENYQVIKGLHEDDEIILQGNQ